MKSAFERALNLHRAGNLDQAAKLYRELLDGKPDDPQCLRLLAIIDNQRGNCAEALGLIESATRLAPNDAQAFNTRGNILRKLSRPEDALASYDKAVMLSPGYAKAFVNRGTLLHEFGRFEEGLESLAKAIALDPTDASAFNNHGSILKAMNRLDEAVKDYDTAIALKPDYSDALKNRGTALHELSRCEEALASYDEALAVRPDYPEALNNRASVLLELGRTEEALASWDAAIALKPNFANAQLNRGMAYLSVGRFEEGWAGFEWRWRANGRPQQPPGVSAPLWRGEDLNSRHILVWAEQGLGDTIQFCRYLPLLAERGAKVTFLAPTKLVRLLRALSGDATIVSGIPKDESFDFHCPLLGLPFRFGTKLGSIPTEIPYLSAEEERIAPWKRRLGEGGFAIGIAWQGNAERRVDRERSIPLAAFLPLITMPGVRVISLQKQGGIDQIAKLPGGAHVETLGDAFDSGPDAFLDSAAVMTSLDLIISSDTSIAHLAGALGRPTWVALKRTPDWRWLQDEVTSPWYPTMRLFRQNNCGDWTDVFARIADRLRAQHL